MSRKQPIIYSGVIVLGYTPYFSAHPFSFDDESHHHHRIAGWHDDGTGSFISAMGIPDLYRYLGFTFADDAEAIEWLLDGEKGGAP